jgi:hypothetical protein
MTVLDLLLQIGLGIGYSAWAVRRDMRALPPAELARAWNDASFWNAVVAFSLVCIPVHFVRTRRSFLGAAAGVDWMLLGLVGSSIIGDAVQRLESVAGF